MSDSADTTSDYTGLVIVAEDQWYSRKQDKTTMCVYNTVWEIWEDFSNSRNRGIEAVLCREFPLERENCHAEVLFITDNALVYKIRQKFSIDNEDDPNGAWGNDFCQSVVIRIFEDKQNIMKEFDNRSAADVTFVVNGKECNGDRKNLASISPVFNAMLYGQFAEGQQDQIELEGIESAEIFKDFLLAVSPLRIQPNPSNVVALLKLAHQYDIPFLMRDCENHLMRCYEISVVDRIFLAGKYGLECLKKRTAQQLSNIDLQQILKEKQDQLRGPESNFLFDIIADRMQEMDNKIHDLEEQLP